MNDLYVDTSGWACWLVARQPFHAKTKAVLTAHWSAGGRAVTTSGVLAELTALLTSPLRVPKPTQIQCLQLLRNDPAVEVVSADVLFDAAAWNLWESRPDKDWSFVDCASFVLLNDRGLTHALTTDHHFEQAGFVRLLK